MLVVLKNLWKKFQFDSTKYEDLKEIFSYDREMLLKFNFWPIEKVGIKFLFVFYITTVLPGMLFCTNNYTSIVELTNAGVELIAFYIFLFKYIIIFIYRDEMESLIMELRNKWAISLAENIDQWNGIHTSLQKSIIKFQKGSLLYFKIGSLNYAAVPIVIGLFKYYFQKEPSQLILIYRSDFIFDVKSNLYVYFTYLLIATPITYYYIILTLLIDNLLFNTLLHIGKYFEFIELKLKRLNDEMMNLTKVELRSNEVLIISRLKEIVKDHLDAIGFVEKFEKIASPVMLMFYLTATFSACFLSFVLILVLNDTQFITRVVIFFITTIFQILLPSYAGNKIIENSAGVGMQAYHCNWYNQSPTIKKMLHMIILRSQKTVGITAGKFYFVSLGSFGSMLRAAISYFTLLRSVYER